MAVLGTIELEANGDSIKSVRATPLSLSKRSKPQGFGASVWDSGGAALPGE